MGMLSQVILNTWAASLRLRASFDMHGPGQGQIYYSWCVHHLNRMDNNSFQFYDKVTSQSGGYYVGEQLRNTSSSHG